METALLGEVYHTPACGGGGGGGGSADAVLYTEQTLTDAQKAQARDNIGIDENTLEILYTIFGEDYVKGQMAKRQYLTFEAVNANTDVQFTCTGDPLTISVSTDGGTTWTQKVGSEEGTTLATLGAGEKLLVKGNNSAYMDMYNDDSSMFSATDDTYVSGNIMSLVAGDNFATATTVGDFAFGLLFADPNGGENSTLLFDANHKLALPATTLGEGCYTEMFSDCTGLTSAPDLPATTLASYCYCDMFYGCTGLTSAPDLPATTLAEGCYSRMFASCTGLTSAPTLLATTLAMNCCDSMFSDCTSLTSAPDLPATTLVEGCYYAMFSGCSNLSSVKCLAETVGRDEGGGATANWLANVAATGTFTVSDNIVPGDVWSYNSSSGIPVGWTVQGGQLPND